MKQIRDIFLCSRGRELHVELFSLKNCGEVFMADGRDEQCVDLLVSDILAASFETSWSGCLSQDLSFMVGCRKNSFPLFFEVSWHQMLCED